MSYELLTVSTSTQLIVRNRQSPANALLLADLRDLLLLRACLNAYIDTLQPDGTLPAAPIPDNELISTVEARRIARDQGITLDESTLRKAVTRGTIGGSVKKGGRWYMPRDTFLAWLTRFANRLR